MRVRKGGAGRLIALTAAAVLAFAAVMPGAFGADESSSPPSSGSVAGTVGAQAEGEVSATATGGPVGIMGIDAEDGGPGGHGPITSYQAVASSILANVTNGGTGILVVGGGKSAGDNVTTFWNAIGAGVGETVTYVNGPANIATQSFAGFKMVGIASGNADTPFGGLTGPENDALTARAADLQAFVNGGGGLLVFSQGFSTPTTPYGFITAVLAPGETFTFTTGGAYDDIDPTPEGIAVGISDDLDVFAWHDTYTSWPSFLVPLAFPSGVTTAVAALGGIAVTIGPPPEVVEVVPTFTG